MFDSETTWHPLTSKEEDNRSMEMWKCKYTQNCNSQQILVNCVLIDVDTVTISFQWSVCCLLS